MSMTVTVVNDVLKYPVSKVFTLSLKTQKNAQHRIWNDVEVAIVKVSGN